MFNMNKVLKIISIFVIVLLPVFIFAQEERSLIREGNRLYREGKFKEALEKFNRAREISGNAVQLESNLGAANYRDSNFEYAVRNFANIADISIENSEKANAFYNIGNSLLQAGEYDKSVQAYRNALRLDPTHDQSRHNLAVATKIMEQQQQPDSDQEKQEDGEEQQEQQDQNDTQEQDDEEQEQEQDQRDMSPEEIERLLEAIDDIDRELQEDLHKNRFETERRDIERNW